MIYDILAPIYDAVNRDIDYPAWADFIERIVEKESRTKPELVLDLGCGTGKMTLELARRGYDMTGVDISTEMLDIARNEAEAAGLGNDILWLCQDIRDFELYGTVDLTVCCLDTINHLTSPKDVERCFSLVHNYLIPDGLFIFDINGKSKFEDTYGQEVYVMDEEDSFCVWQNQYNKKSHLCDFLITVFAQNENGSYDRYDEVQTERMYTIRSITKKLKDTGFELIGTYSDFDNTTATDESDRIYIVARCIKE